MQSFCTPSLHGYLHTAACYRQLLECRRKPFKSASLSPAQPRNSLSSVECVTRKLMAATVPCTHGPRCLVLWEPPLRSNVTVCHVTGLHFLTAKPPQAVTLMNCCGTFEGSRSHSTRHQSSSRESVSEETCAAAFATFHSPYFSRRINFDSPPRLLCVSRCKPVASKPIPELSS